MPICIIYYFLVKMLYNFVVFFLSCVLVVTSRSDDFEESLPLIFPQIFIQPFAREFNNNSNILPEKHYNTTIKRKPARNNVPYGYLKGYSLKIPNHRLFVNGLVSNIKLLEEEMRTKRGVAHLYNMISCATGCNPLSYKGYGCFCGLFGSGIPVDDIDSCCKTHDWCYDAANCPMFLEYFVPYYWKCWYNRPICATDHGNLGGSGSCADMLCECDRALSECLQKYSCPSRSQKTFCKSSPFRLLQNAFRFLT